MRTIQLSRGYQAVVDDEDYDRLSKFNWNAMIRKGKIYAVAGSGRPSSPRILMHRVIMDTPDGMACHHIVKEHTLFNSKVNLINVTHQVHRWLHCLDKNPQGVSGYVGVRYNAANKCYFYSVCNPGGTRIPCHTYKDPKEAAIYRDLTMISVGAPACALNFPQLAEILDVNPGPQVAEVKQIIEAFEKI